MSAYLRFMASLLLCVLAVTRGVPSYSGAVGGRTDFTPAAKARILIVTGGHEFDAAGFTGMFRRMRGLSYETVTFGQGAEGKLNPQAARPYDAIVFYDMHQNKEPHGSGMLQLLAQGKGMVFLHHSLWSYDGTWNEYARIVGGRASSKEKVVPGPSPTSTYKHGEHVHVHVVDPADPITKGLKDFDITDETYNHYWVDPGMHVLLTTDNPTSEHIIAWSHQYQNSRVVYIELGHGPTAYENSNYITLVQQAIFWAAGKRP